MSTESFYFLSFINMITLVSKGNGRNYYGFFDDKIQEVIKVRGCFYVAKLKHGELTATGDALHKDEFTLVE